MMIGTLAIAGIPPLAGFFSKDEILFRAFLSNKVIWVLAVVTALMTAFYMFRLMSMTFFGGYRGPAWEPAGAGPAAAAIAARHGVAHPDDTHGHGPKDKDDHEVSHGPAEPHDPDGGHGSGHGPWHGPHESPTPMTFPLMALAVGAIVAGFFGIPAALGGSNAIERFLEPSFTPSAVHAEAEGTRPSAGAGAAEQPATGALPAEAAAEHEAPHASSGLELGLMGFSVLIAVVGICARVEVLRHQPRDLGEPGRAMGGRAPRAVEQVLRRRAVRRHSHCRHHGRGP